MEGNVIGSCIINLLNMMHDVNGKKGLPDHRIKSLNYKVLKRKQPWELNMYT